MQVKKLTNPAALAVSLNEVKDHLRIERDDTDFDEDLTSLIYAATAYVESETHQTVMETTYEATFECFPEGPMKIPGWPMNSIGSVTYLDELGNEEVVDEFQSDLTQSPVLIAPLAETMWPKTQEGALRPIKVVFSAGYGTTDLETPPMLKAMIKLLIAHWFKNREAISNKGVVTTYPLAFEALRDQVRVNEFVPFKVGEDD